MTVPDELKIREWMKQLQSAKTDKDVDAVFESMQAHLGFCERCDWCGWLADSTEREPWIYWHELPEQSKTAIRMGLVQPIPCECNAEHENHPSTWSKEDENK